MRGEVCGIMSLEGVPVKLELGQFSTADRLLLRSSEKIALRRPWLHFLEGSHADFQCLREVKAIESSVSVRTMPLQNVPETWSMPWKERSIVEERMRFVLRLKKGANSA